MTQLLSHRVTVRPVPADPNVSCLFAAGSPTDTVGSQNFQTFSTRQIAFWWQSGRCRQCYTDFLLQCAGDIKADHTDSGIIMDSAELRGWLFACLSAVTAFTITMLTHCSHSPCCQCVHSHHVVTVLTITVMSQYSQSPYYHSALNRHVITVFQITAIMLFIMAVLSQCSQSPVHHHVHNRCAIRMFTITMLSLCPQ